MSISIGNNSLFALTTENANSKAKADALSEKVAKASLASTDEEMMEACKTFESYMVEQMIEALKKTVPKNEEEGDYESYFSDMLYQGYAEQITESGELGIAQQLYESMKLNYKGL